MLERAFQNTVALLKSEIVVEETEQISVWADDEATAARAHEATMAQQAQETGE